ncbi:unnamed protein product, partial [Coccothraustes coccothraustes]
DLLPGSSAQHCRPLEQCRAWHCEIQFLEGIHLEQPLLHSSVTASVPGTKSIHPKWAELGLLSRLCLMEQPYSWSSTPGAAAPGQWPSPGSCPHPALHNEENELEIAWWFLGSAQHLPGSFLPAASGAFPGPAQLEGQELGPEQCPGQELIPGGKPSAGPPGAQERAGMAFPRGAGIAGAG